MTMRADEVAEVTVRADFGYQTLDAVADAAKGERLILRLQLVDFTTERTPWDSEDAEELLGMAEARKAAGNEQFKRGDVPRAFQHYKRATHATGVILLSFDHERTKEGDEAEEKITIHAADGPKRRARRLECSVKANMAACHVKLGEWKKCKDICLEILEHEDHNAKAHYRLGIAYDLGALTRDWRYNARLGTDYLAGLVDEFGSLPMAAAGYNAGPNRVRQWVERYGDPRTGRIDMIDWIETIPFDETRNYVQRVMEGLHVYDARLSGQAQGPLLTARLARP